MALSLKIGWFILFIGACVSGYGGVIWWIIIYELAVFFGILYVLMQAILPDYRLLVSFNTLLWLGIANWPLTSSQVLACLAISVTLLTQTIDNQLHIGLGSAKASAGGGIMIIMVQFFWIFMFGSSQDSSIHGAIYGIPSGMPSSAKHYDKEGTMPLSTPTNYSISQYDSVHSGIAPTSHAVSYPPQQQSQYPAYTASPSPTATDAKNNAIALHPYTANPDDPNELSFHKGEVLEILDRRGNWWQARKQDQTIGIVPSNYVSRAAPMDKSQV
ncbi:hypothetical protein [Absidia glauca]|uniref:SH3 domain-containing protein n=1 Tax=Absidia glauca TaxID=4829 RepID=A0A163MF08_ABSGL|nr:hypothetical protein [Absidia glauca]